MQQIQADYLQQLGIQQWMPRRPLASAAESPQWVYRFVHPAELLDGADEFADYEETSPAKSSVKRAPEPHAEQRALAHIQEALEVPENRRVTAATPPPASQKPPVAQVSASRVAPARFRLALARTHRTLFIDQLPMQGAMGFSQQHSRLLAYITRALGEDPAQLSMPTILQWPLLAGKTLNQGPEEAYKNVQRQLEWMLKDTSVQRIILFGQGLPRWAIRLNSDADESAQGVHPVWNLPFVATSSLTQALQLPELKRQIWLDIQSLIREH